MRRGSQLRATSYLIIAIAMAIVLLSAGQALHLDRAQGVAATIFEPAQSVFSGIGRTVRENILALNHIGQLRSENAELKARVADLQKQLLTAQQNAIDDKALRASLGLRDQLKIRTIAAEVIGRDPEGLSQHITIHAGARQGLKKGMVVLGQHGLVGRVVAVQPSSAQVQLVSDANSPVNVLLATSHLSGTLRVVAGKMEVEIFNAPINLTVPSGEQLVTSGVGGNFPKGVPIAGIVSYQYQAYGVSQVAEAAPLDNLARLEYAVVDLDFLPEGMP
jgi:rod shape-determining protein MreC